MTFKKIRGVSVLAALMILFSSFTAQMSASKVRSQTDIKISTLSAVSKTRLFAGVGNATLKNAKTYKDRHFNFTVSYPANWKSNVEKYWTATSSQEGAPDGGIDIYVESSKSSTIRVFGQYGTLNGESMIDFSESTKETFVTASGLTASLYYTDSKKTKQIVLLLDDHHAVQIKISDAAFTRNEQPIYAILKSIKIIKG